MSYPSHIWDQVKNITCDELMGALGKDGWVRDEREGSVVVYRHSDGRRVAIHYHPRKTFGRDLLKAMLRDIGWHENDLRHLKLIK